MAVYIGSKCIVCEKEFTKNDEIVVCPDCGTPYHRSCYLSKGKCINTELHERNEDWKPDIIETNEEISDIICGRCGQSNPHNGLFCLKCGNPLSKMQKDNPFPQGSSNPFFGSLQTGGQTGEKLVGDNEIDGIKIKDYSEYVAKNQLYYIPQFVRFDKLKSKFSLNIFAMVFPEYFFFYRKMNFLGVVFLILRFFAQIPLIITAITDGILNNTFFSDVIKITISEGDMAMLSNYASFLSYLTMFFCAFFGNWFYYKKIKKDINHINSVDITEDEKTSLIRKKGGISFRNMLIAVFAPSVLIIISLIIASVIK